MTESNVETLADLKAKLAKEDAAAAEQAKAAQATKANLDAETPPDELETPPEQDDKPTDEQVADSAISADQDSKEAWMESEQPSLKGDDKKVVPVGALKKERQKYRVRLEERDDEITTLKKQLEEVTRLVRPPTLAEMPKVPLKRPDPLDYQNDPAQYRAAEERWLAEQTDRRIEQRFQNLGKEAQEAERKRQLEKSLDSHYQEVNELLEQNKLNREDYQENELQFRRAIKYALPANAKSDPIADQLIAKLGAGSSKVIWYLGKNPSALNKFSNLLASDPSGFDAFAYLAEVKAERAISPRIAHSKAPAPATRASGNAGGSGGDDLKKRFQKAAKDNDAEGMFQARRAARAAGLNPDKF